MAKLGFGIIGCGVIHRWHASAIQSLGGDVAEVVAVCDVVEQRAKDAAEKLGATAYTDIHEMLRDKRVDIVTVGTPSGMHIDHAIEAVMAGKHVIVEKPFDINLDKVDRFIAAAKDAGVYITCVSQTRYAPGVRQLHEWLDSGKLGKLIYADATVKWHRTQEYYNSGDWRGTWALDGGGALMNQGIHYADQLRWAMGNPKSLFAYASTGGHDIEVEDVVTASIQFENGGIGSLTATTCAYPGFEQTLDIFGTEGSVRMADQEVIAAHFVNGEKYERPEAKAAGATASDPAAVGSYNHGLQFRDFVDAINNKRKPFVGAREGREALETVLAVYESARTGQPVTFPLRPSKG